MSAALRSLIGRLGTARLAVVLSLWLVGCAVNPATGDRSFVGFLPPDEEAAFGAKTHPEILKQFGGIHDDPELGAYVAAVGGRLTAVAERPDLRFTFTVLDSPIVNAFAIPGGYVYVTRGLLALADNEAELASVLGHEIGHVTALHGAQRVSRGALAGLGVAILGAAIGQDAVTELFGLGANALLQSYSREQELEADMLGLRYTARAGYDPLGAARFLAKLREKSRLQARMSGSGDPDGFDLFASHPRPLDRVQQAAALAATGDGEVGRDAYLDRIDGLVYGDSPRHGFVRGLAFLHPELRIGFTVPEGFSLRNNPDSVRAANADRSAGLIFDSVRVRPGVSPQAYLTRVWAPSAEFLSFDKLTLGSYPAATGLVKIRTPDGFADLRFLAIRERPDRVYRFLFINRSAERARFSPAFRETAFSFRTLTDHDLAQLRPQRIRIVRVEPGDTVSRMARQIPPGPLREERFRLLNGLTDAEDLTPGERIKTVR